jgi:ketosteroid isomerase-like protein
VRRALALLVLAACPKPTTGARGAPVGDPFSGESSDETAVLRHELEAEVRESYERDEVSTSEDWQDVLDPALGIVRFGVRPDDEQIVTRGATPPRRLPLRIVAGDDGAGACDETLRSNDLRLYLSPDASTAWVTDELTACVPACGKRALLPLRLSAVYVRGGDRWVLAVEHLSYPQPAASLIARGDDHATTIGPFVSRRASAPDLANLVPTAIAQTVPADRGATFATDPDALAWWPDPAHELRGAAISGGPSLTDAFDAASITAEGARIGIGPQSGTGAIAWWAGTILVHARKAGAITAGATEEVPVRLRATFVMRRDPDRWRIVQSHVSAPIDDQTLAHEIASDATIVDGRIIVPCDRATPAAARR